MIEIFIIFLLLISLGIAILYSLGIFDKYFPASETEEKEEEEEEEEEEGTFTQYVPTNTGTSTQTFSFPKNISGLTGKYTTVSFDPEKRIWLDVSGAKNHIVTTTGNTFGVTDSYVYGTKTDGLRLPTSVMGTTGDYTLFYVARYNGENKKRIFVGMSDDWLSGFDDGKTGVSKHGSFLTKNESIHGPHAWIQGTDSPNKMRTFGKNRVINASVYGKTEQITLNAGQNTSTYGSDWAVKEIIVYNRNLTVAEIEKVEKYMINRYFENLKSDISYASGFKDIPERIIDDPQGVPYGYGTLEQCRKRAIDLGYPIWGHTNMKTENEEDRNKCFYYGDGAFTEFEDDENDVVHTIGCTTEEKSIFDGCTDE